jgi:hypothetical protein
MLLLLLFIFSLRVLAFCIDAGSMHSECKPGRSLFGVLGTLGTTLLLGIRFRSRDSANNNRNLPRHA